MDKNCWHFWRKRYGIGNQRKLCDVCLKKHPDYWKWKMSILKSGGTSSES